MKMIKTLLSYIGLFLCVMWVMLTMAGALFGPLIATVWWVGSVTEVSVIHALTAIVVGIALAVTVAVAWGNLVAGISEKWMREEFGVNNEHN